MCRIEEVLRCTGKYFDSVSVESNTCITCFKYTLFDDWYSSNTTPVSGSHRIVCIYLSLFTLSKYFLFKMKIQELVHLEGRMGKI